MVSVHEVANYFILRGLDDVENFGEYLTHLKLQKLVYFSQAWHLGIYGQRLFPESMQAWVHGPVCREVYDELKGQGWTPIVRAYSAGVHDVEIETFLDQVWSEYGKYSAKSLEQMTHQDEPWLAARDGLGPLENSERVIDIEIMRRVYSARASENGGQAE